MVKIDESIEFIPIHIAVLTISDTRTVETDKSGKILIDLINQSGHKNIEYAIVKDDVEEIKQIVRDWIHHEKIDVILTTGGTGLTGKDVTLNAIKPLLAKEIEGFSTIFHLLSYQSVGTSTIQSRAFAGVIEQTYVFCVPGSPGACKDAWNGILKYQLDNRHKPCNLVDIMPRLNE